MQRLEVSGVVRLIYRSLGVKGLKCFIPNYCLLIKASSPINAIRRQQLIPTIVEPLITDPSTGS